MKQRKAPLSPEEEHEICRKCGGFCCKYYFSNADNNTDAEDLHKFRGRKMIRYGKVKSVILSDTCPWTNDKLKTCTKYEEPGFPNLCRKFPDKYRPFWNLYCKLMRVRYARGLIPKDIVGFNKLKVACGYKSKPFKFFK
jgi:hypothetical protein